MEESREDSVDGIDPDLWKKMIELLVLVGYSVFVVLPVALFSNGVDSSELRC